MCYTFSDCGTLFSYVIGVLESSRMTISLRSIFSYMITSCVFRMILIYIYCISRALSRERGALPKTDLITERINVTVPGTVSIHRVISFLGSVAAPFRERERERDIAYYRSAGPLICSFIISTFALPNAIHGNVRIPVHVRRSSAILRYIRFGEAV